MPSGEYGYGDTELGFKYRFIQEDDKGARPQVDLPDPEGKLIEHLQGRIAALEARLAELERRSDVSTSAL